MWNDLITDSMVIASLTAKEAWDNYVSATNDVALLLRGEEANTYARYLYAEVAKQSLYVHFERVEEELGQQ